MEINTIVKKNYKKQIKLNVFIFSSFRLNCIIHLKLKIFDCSDAIFKIWLKQCLCSNYAQLEKSRKLIGQKAAVHNIEDLIAIDDVVYLIMHAYPPIFAIRFLHLTL